MGGHPGYLEQHGSPSLEPVRHTVFLLLAAFVGSVWFTPMTRAAEPCEPAVAEIVSVQGAVDLRRAGETRWQPAGLGEPVCIGDVVRTGRVSRAALVFANDSVLRLDQLTELRLRAVAEQQRSLLDMMAGAIQFFSRRPRALEIDTPFVTAAGEGTEFFVRVADDRTRVIVFEGRVRVVNPEGELLLADGDAAIAARGEAPRSEIIVRPRDAVAWALYYPPVLSALAERRPRPQALPMGLERAVQLVATNDYAGALDALDAVPEAERDVRYWTFRAGALLNVGRVEEAQAAIDRALALDPDSAGALAQRAIILIARQEEEQALADARRAVEFEPASAPARIALSYAHQARAELEPARAVLREAVEHAPDDALAWARLAEIELSFGNLDAAEEAAEQATALAPDLGRTQMVRGFAELVRIDIDQAKAAFERAIELDSANPLPRLGLGLARIRESDLDEGRREIEIAAGLDPSDALVRSYLGKAYFEETREDKAATQFQIAKDLDPNDPTPYFYDAIRKQLENRPVEALQDLETAIDLNDNRAVYRSRLLLDQDLATRSVSLARIYDDLGFDQLAVTEASRSLSQDPSNWSAHRFLSDAYARLPRHEIARASELLQAQLLQPININPVQPSLAVTDLNIVEGIGPAEGAFNEFHPLFERNRAQLTATGVVGNGDGNEDTFGDEIVASGLWNRVSLSAGQFHFQTNGFRENNDLETDLYDVFAQVAVTPKLNLQAEYRRRDTEHGDLGLDFDPENFSTFDRREIKQDTGRVGLRYEATRGSDIIGSFFFSDLEETQERLIRDEAVDIIAEDDGYQAEAQYLFRTNGLNVTAGFGVNDIDAAFTIRGLTDKSEIEQETAYIYANLEFPRNVVWTAGVGYDAFQRRDLDIEEFNPKIGVQWSITTNARLRVAYFESVKRALIVDQTIEPTQIAAFNQFFDDFNGTKSNRLGVGFDARVTQNLYAGLEFSWRDLEVPFVSTTTFTTVFEDQDENIYGGYLYWVPHDRWSVSVEPHFEKFSRDESQPGDIPIETETFSLPSTIRYFDPSGVFVQLRGTYGDQSVELSSLTDFDKGGDEFLLVDAAVGYRLPNRRGILSLEARNLLDEEFLFQDADFRTSEPRTPRYTPDRTLLARLTLTF